jgi:hypothetical protein
MPSTVGNWRIGYVRKADMVIEKEHVLHPIAPPFAPIFVLCPCSSCVGGQPEQAPISNERRRRVIDHPPIRDDRQIVGQGNGVTDPCHAAAIRGRCEYQEGMVRRGILVQIRIARTGISPGGTDPVIDPHALVKPLIVLSEPAPRMSPIGGIMPDAMIW